jgi:hypothetical protein
LKAILLVEILLLPLLAFAGNKPASCGLGKNTAVTLSPEGLPQVSNLTTICIVPARPFPTKPGEFQNGLQAETTVYEVLGDGSKRVVPSDVTVHGGGGGGWASNPPPEWVDFDAFIPLDPAERDEEALKFLAFVEQGLAPEQLTNKQRQNAMEVARYVVEHTQHRVGHFQIECSVVDGANVVGVGIVEVIVAYKGRFSDTLPGISPAETK